MYLLSGVLNSHDRARFKIHAYSLGPDSMDRYRESVKDSVEVFRDVRMMSDKDAASLIAGDGIDILIDLTGSTKDSRICSPRLDPRRSLLTGWAIQARWAMQDWPTTS